MKKSEMAKILAFSHAMSIFKDSGLGSGCMKVWTENPGAVDVVIAFDDWFDDYHFVSSSGIISHWINNREVEISREDFIQKAKEYHDESL